MYVCVILRQGAIIWAGVSLPLCENTRKLRNKDSGTIHCRLNNLFLKTISTVVQQVQLVVLAMRIIYQHRNRL